MANTVRLKRSAVQGKAPVVGDLSLGELAVNTYDGKLYMKKNDGSDAIVEIGAGGTTVSATAPSSPSTGDLWYDTEDARTFVWTGTEWVDAAPDAGYAVATTSDSAPANANDGDLWYRTSDGRMYVYYDDGSTAQWVDANPNLPVGSDTFERSGTTVSLANSGDTVSLDGDLTVDTNTLHVDSTNNLVGIGTTSPAVDFEVIGTARATALSVDASGYFTLTSGNPLLNFDSNDYLLYDRTSNHLQFVSGGSERMRIDSSGNVGIGTTAPDGLLHVSGSNPSIYIETANANEQSDIIFQSHVGGDQGSVSYSLLDNSLRFTTNGTSNERMRLDSSGNVGINETSPDSTLHVTGPSSGTILTLDRAGSYSWKLGQTSGSDLTITGDTSERTRILTTGNFYNRGDLDSHTAVSGASAGTSYFLYRGRRGSTILGDTTAFIVWSNGNVQNSNNSYGAISDAKLKENIVDAASQWDDLKAIQIRKYNFKEETGQPTHTQLGVVAQEIELVSPGLVSESPDRDDEGNDLGTTTKSVNYSVLYIKAVKALQEAMDRIETLEQRLDDAGL